MGQVMIGYIEAKSGLTWKGLYETLIDAGYMKYGYEVLIRGSMGAPLEIPSIGEERGFPDDMSQEFIDYLDYEYDFYTEINPELYHRSYVYLDEIVEFNWTNTIEFLGKRLTLRELIGKQFWSLVNELEDLAIKYDKIRIILWIMT